MTGGSGPSVACACGHLPEHHNKRRSVYAGLMADYKVVWACGWTGCGCPRFVQAANPPAKDASVAVDFYGQDSEWPISEGHVDLDAFEDAVRRELTALGYGEDFEGFDVPPQHAYMRPITREECDSDEEFEWRREDGWMTWANVAPDEPGAVPITLGGLPC